MPKLGRNEPVFLDNDYALYTPFGTDNTPNLVTKIVASRSVLTMLPPELVDDPAIQPTKPIANLAARDESQYRKIPKGRYDTTYRREYLNFNHTDSTSSLNPYHILPPITTQAMAYNSSRQQLDQQQQMNYMSPPIDHIINDPQYQQQLQQQSSGSGGGESSYAGGGGGGGAQLTIDKNTDSYLPIDPIYLNAQEEQSLVADVSRELTSYSSSKLKNFYSELTSYDPNMSGFTHHTYISLVAMRNNLPLSEPVMRFVMSRFVSSSQERGNVNYEELVKFLAKCMGDASGLSRQSQRSQPLPTGQSAQYGDMGNSGMFSTGRQIISMPPEQSSRIDMEKYDPDEQAILRLMHENMRDWDQVNLIDCDNLRRKFYEIDPYNRYILSQREIEDVLYKNRIPIQRSLTYQILEKYCKVATGQYRWPAFVDFLEKTYKLKLPNKKKTYYTLRQDEKDSQDSQFTYRSAHLDSLRAKASEEERIEEINKQIYSLQNLKQETKQRIDSRMDDGVRGESWFTRFMRLANAMYTHRVNAGTTFSLPKDEARRLITAYNTVYELNIQDSTIEEGLNRCTMKGNVVIDDLLKVLSRVQ